MFGSLSFAAWGFGTLGGVRSLGVRIFGIHCLGVRNFGSTVFWLAAWGFGTLGGVRSLGVRIFGSIVEVTHKHREHYELLWPDKDMQQTTFTAKDTIVSMATTITSLLGAVSHIMLDVSLANGHSSTNIDACAHARFIMVLAATTNMLSAVMLYPVYSMIVFQKFITCTVTDVSTSIMSVVDVAGNKKQPSMLIKYKDNMDEATEKAG